MDPNLEYGAPVQRRPRRRSRLEPILLLSFILCLLIGSGALAAMVWLNRTEDVRAARPMYRTITQAAIRPQLTLRQLTGDPAVPLAYQALAAGELETASAILAYDPQITGSELSSLYHRLARQTAARGVVQQSVSLYETMRAIAVLDPELSANERIQLLQRSAEGLIASGQANNALISAEQAKRVAAQTPDILPAQRSRFFEGLLPLARELDDELFLQQIEEFVRNPFVDIRGVIAPVKLDTLGQPLQSTPAIEAAIDNRRQAALQLVEQLTGDPQILAAVQANQLPAQQNLAAALVAEDSTRTAFFNETSATGNALSLQQQLTLLEERQSWLALKLRIANRGFGLPLVPQWEQGIDALQTELAVVTQNIDRVIDALVVAETSAQSSAALRVEKVRRLALLTELGLYPGSTARDFIKSNAFRNAQDEARNQGLPLALPILFDVDAEIVSYRFSEPISQQ